MDMEKLLEVISKNHMKGSRRGHKKEGRKKIQIDFDIKLVEIEARINALIELLPKEEELRTTEHEEEVHIICEP